MPWLEAKRRPSKGSSVFDAYFLDDVAVDKMLIRVTVFPMYQLSLTTPHVLALCGVHNNQTHVQPVKIEQVFKPGKSPGPSHGLLRAAPSAYYLLTTIVIQFTWRLQCQ